MPSFERIKELKSILNEFPGIHTYKELDILIEIGYHEEIGKPLTVKQLNERGAPLIGHPLLQSYFIA